VLGEQTNVSEESIKRVSTKMGILNTKEERQDFSDLTDWERVKSMSDAEIEANALSDPDALPFDDDWENAAIISAYNKLTSQ
jgi:hypothetical protein